MTINVCNRECELKFGIRSLMMFENIAEHEFKGDNLIDVVTMLYCIVVSSTKDYSLTMDDFIEYLDENPDVMQKIATWLSTVQSTQDIIKKKSEPKARVKKKSEKN